MAISRYTGRRCTKRKRQDEDHEIRSNRAQQRLVRLGPDGDAGITEAELAGRTYSFSWWDHEFDCWHTEARGLLRMQLRKWLREYLGHWDYCSLLVACDQIATPETNPGTYEETLALEACLAARVSKRGENS